MCWKECVYRCSKKCSKSCSQWVQKTFIWHLLPFLLMIVIINRIYWSAILRCQITHKIMLYLTADLISFESWNANCALKWMPFCIFMLNSHVREHVWNYWTYNNNFMRYDNPNPISRQNMFASVFLVDVECNSRQWPICSVAEKATFFTSARFPRRSLGGQWRQTTKAFGGGLIISR